MQRLARPRPRSAAGLSRQLGGTDGFVELSEPSPAAHRRRLAAGGQRQQQRYWINDKRKLTS